jgi:outer membrane protein TolC
MNTSSARLLLLIAAALSVAPKALPDDLPAALDLRTAIGYALDHNFAIRQAREQIRDQEGLVVQVKARQLPNLSAAGQYQGQQASVSIFYNETALWDVQLTASQTLFAGGGIRSSVKNAEYTRDAAVLDLQSTVNNALLDVRTRFYNVLLDREKVRVQEQNVALFERQLSDTENQLKAGTVSNFEVLRAEVSLANAQPDLITARNDYRIAIEQLREALGVPPAPRGVVVAFPEVAGDLSVTPETYDPEAALLAARVHRPELLRLDRLKSAGEQSVRTAASTYYPTVSAFGGYQWNGFGIAPSSVYAAYGANFSARGWLWGVQSSWAIFDGRATAGKVRQARSQLEQTRLSQASTELAIDVEVRQALSSLQEAAELVAASGKTVDQAVEALRLANERYRVGSATQLDVLTSQVALTQARTNQLQSNYTYLVALASLRKAIGQPDALVGN